MLGNSQQIPQLVFIISISPSQLSAPIMPLGFDDPHGVLTAALCEQVKEQSAHFTPHWKGEGGVCVCVGLNNLSCSQIIFIQEHSIRNHVLKIQQPQSRSSSPDDVIVVSQVELLGVFSRVVDHAHPRHEVDHLLPRRVVKVVATLVTSVPVDPLQAELAARRRLIRHDRPSKILHAGKTRKS